MEFDTLALNAWLERGTLFHHPSGDLLLGWGSVHSHDTPVIQAEKPQFFFYNFSLSVAHPFFTFSHTMRLSRQKLEDALRGMRAPPVEAIAWETPNFSAFELAFTGLQQRRLLKGVPYTVPRANQKMSSNRKIHTLLSLMDHLKNHKGYVYGMWEGERGTMGVTPEQLFHLHSPHRLDTMAVAGTIPATAPAEDLLDDPKQRNEHSLVIEGIRHALGERAEVRVGETVVKTFGRLSHLVTPISATLVDDLPLQELIRSLHPTPALGAFPKAEGREWLDEQDRVLPRGSFGAPVGWIEGGEAIAYVAIRNVAWDPNGMAIFAGCGVVKESHLEEEWKELQHKIAAIKQMCGMEAKLTPTLS